MSFGRSYLDKMHARATERHAWYKKWHERPYHRQVHYTVAHLVGWPLVAVIITSLIVTTASLNMIWSTQSVQAAGKTWTSYADFNAWTKTNTIARSSGALTLDYTVGDPSLTATIPGSFIQPTQAVMADNGYVYVGDNNVASIQKINPATNAVVSTVNIGDRAHGLIKGANGHLYAVTGDSLFDIDPSNDSFTGPYEIDPSSVSWAVVQAPNGYLYISGLSSGYLRVFDLDTHTVIASIAVGANTRDLTIDSAGNIYATNINSSTISVIDSSTNTVTQTISGAALSSPSGAVKADNGYLYVSNSGASNVLKFDLSTGTVVATIAVSSIPSDIVLDNNGQLWVANMYGNNTNRINPATDTVTGTITTTGYMHRFVSLVDDGDIYVGATKSDWTTGEVLRINTGTLSYSTSGTATTSYTPTPGQQNTWSSATVDQTAAAGSTLTMDYSSDDATWTSDISAVPVSETLYARASFAGGGATSVSLNSLIVDYAAYEGGGSGNEPSGNTPVVNEPASNASANTSTNSEEPAVTSNTTTVTNSGNEPVANPVTPPQNVHLSIGPNQVRLTFDKPAAGNRVRIWRSLDAFSDGLLIESVDGNEFTEIPSLISGYKAGTTIYYHVDTFRLSDQQISTKVAASGFYPVTYYYGISISTRNVTVKPGETTQLSAVVYDQDGAVVNQPVTWTVGDPELGTVTSTGLFTAGQKTGYWANGLLATVDDGTHQGSATVSASVDQMGSVIAGIDIEPSSITLQPGQTQSYVIYQYDQYGARRAVGNQSNAIWSAKAGTMNGNTLTAGSQAMLSNEGVTANYTDATGRQWVANARVAVSTELPYLNRVYLTGTQRLATGSSMRFYTWGYDQFNNYLSKNVKRTYSSEDTSAAVIDSVGNVHAGDKVGCFYWILRGDQAYDGRTDYGLSGIITQPLTDEAMAKLDQARLVAWRQVKYVYQPNEQYQLSAYVYNGWSVQAPGEYAEYEMADSDAGSITPNGLLTVASNAGTYKNAINIYFVNTLTGERRLGSTFSLTISTEPSKLTSVTTGSITTRSHWHWAVGGAIKDQFGYPYRGAITYRWSLTGGNSEIKQNGIINTGDAEWSPKVVNLTVKTDDGATHEADSRGGITSLDDFSSAKYCSVSGTTVASGGTMSGPDGELLTIDEASLDNLVDQLSTVGASTITTGDRAQAAQNALAPLTAIALVAAVPGLVSGLMQVLGTSFSRLGSSVLSFFQFIGLSRRNTNYGLVTSRRRPVGGALVELLSPVDRRVIENQRTDTEGRYIFRHNVAGSYLLRVSAAGYETIELRVGRATIHRHIRLGQSSGADDARLARHRRWSVIARQLVWISLAILIIGTSTWFVMIKDGQTGVLPMLMGAYYALAWLLEGLLLAMPRPFGSVKDAQTGLPIALATVRITDRAGRLVATEITDRQGRYRALLSAGTYDLVFSRLGYQPETKRRLVVSRASAAAGQDISLRRQ